LELEKENHFLYMSSFLETDVRTVVLRTLSNRFTPVSCHDAACTHRKGASWWVGSTRNRLALAVSYQVLKSSGPP